MDLQGRERGVLYQRRAGVLLHPTSLPCALHGSMHDGALGPQAYHFIDFLTSAGMSVWQVLPLHPPHADASPYNARSAFAGSPSMVSLELAGRWGWLARAPAAADLDTETARRDWLQSLGREFARRAHDADLHRYERFCIENADWLDDYALYTVAREALQCPWQQWPAQYRDRNSGALGDFRRQHATDIEVQRVLQFAFCRQWLAIRHYAHGRDVFLFGDVPIFVAPDSADTWSHRHLFTLDATGVPSLEAGVPPDYFSQTGQHWGNPLYNWEREEDGCLAWWRRRLQYQLRLFDLVRIDHFRGFDACWGIPPGAPPSAGGWVPGPGAHFFEALRAEFNHLPIVAEDLGVITPEVQALRDRFELPGMRVLQFGFDGNPHNLHLPHEHTRIAVVYTGTHDNDTTIGWYEALPADLQKAVRDYCHDDSAMPWPLIRAAMASVCALAIIPMQDVLGLGSAARMNTPGTTSGNWQWRFAWSDIPANSVERVRQYVHRYGRA